MSESVPWLSDRVEVQLLSPWARTAAETKVKSQELTEQLIFLAVRLCLALLGAQIRDLLFERGVFLLEGGHILVILPLVGGPIAHGGGRGAEGRGQHARDVFKHRGGGGKIGQHTQKHSDRRCDGQNAQSVLTEKFFQGLPSFRS